MERKQTRIKGIDHGQFLVTVGEKLFIYKIINKNKSNKNKSSMILLPNLA